jgi:hypothetical protein
MEIHVWETDVRLKKRKAKKQEAIVVESWDKLGARKARGGTGGGGGGGGRFQKNKEEEKIIEENSVQALSNNWPICSSQSIQCCNPQDTQNGLKRCTRRRRLCAHMNHTAIFRVSHGNQKPPPSENRTWERETDREKKKKKTRARLEFQEHHSFIPRILPFSLPNRF